jgi:mannose/fructose/N-acetylgalactosamine-specific phosphotransferase system component IIB
MQSMKRGIKSLNDSRRYRNCVSIPSNKIKYFIVNLIKIINDEIMNKPINKKFLKTEYENEIMKLHKYLYYYLCQKCSMPEIYLQFLMYDH